MGEGGEKDEEGRGRGAGSCYRWSPATGGPRLRTVGLLLALDERLDVGMWLEATLDVCAWGSGRDLRWVVDQWVDWEGRGVS